MRKEKTYRLVRARNVFIVTLAVIVLTTLGVYFWGLGHHRTFFENSIMSTTVLAISFFSFTTIGLYRGMKLQDDVGKVTHLYKRRFFRPESSNDSGSSFLEGLDLNGEMPDVDDGEFLSVLIAILCWVLIAIIVAFSVVFIGDILIVSVLAFVGMLYWIFFRALRLVFKNSNRSKGDLLASMKWGLFYTILYSGWIYGIFFLIEVIKR